MSTTPEPVKINAVARARSKAHISDIAINGRVSSQRVVETLLPKVTTPDCEPYALDLIIPTNMPGVEKTVSFASTGRSLDSRRVSVAVLPDGNASLAASEDNGVQWFCVGVFGSEQNARETGDRWLEGSLSLDLSHRPKSKS
ncbi:hypothetical protein GCM10019059_39940 [Camelimonas fluminis]|uniref:Uncharacterized protein n=1 Tax=Camelimonas fluminis TaxID=1576911 RepID=A0ABV7UJV3_9HYPH|nr:hypothetical protein [Camelimonas fluminis]GHE76698.1 hypothetical protein GCM10019059_39940 [Camelimonas fluminis]